MSTVSLAAVYASLLDREAFATAFTAVQLKSITAKDMKYFVLFIFFKKLVIYQRLYSLLIF